MNDMPNEKMTPIPGSEGLGRFTGLIAAPFTAYDRAGNVALDKIHLQAERLLQDGVAGVFICGTTGEGALLTPDERVRIARRWVEVARGSLKIIVNISNDSPAVMRELAESSFKDNAHAVGCTSPCYFAPKGAGELVGLLRFVTESVPTLPLYYYHMPSITRTRFRASEVVAAAGVMGNFAGVKFTDENLMDFAACVDLSQGRSEVLFGRDELFISGLAFGATGAVGSTYNFLAPLYLKIYRHMMRGELDLALKLQRISHHVISALIEAGGVIPAGKALMKMQGLDLGSVRLPLAPVSLVAVERLARTITELAVFPIGNAETHSPRLRPL